MTLMADPVETKIITQPTRNLHHLWFTRKAYTTKLEVDFRTLPCSVVDMSYWAHQIIHEVPHTHLHGLYEPPRKPRVGIMELFVYRHRAKQCSCTTEKVKVSVFNLLRPTQLETQHLPCAYFEVYTDQLRLIRTHYKENLHITPANRFVYQSEHLEYLELVHGLGFCSCWQSTRHIQMEVPVWRAA
jgi:hypothetical protein